MPRRDLPPDDDAPVERAEPPDEPDDEPEVTARPSERLPREADGEDDRLVPMENVGGAAPTPLGLDSGGNLPGPADDLSSLPEPEPPEPPEVGAVHVRDREP